MRKIITMFPVWQAGVRFIIIARKRVEVIDI